MVDATMAHGWIREIANFKKKTLACSWPAVKKLCGQGGQPGNLQAYYLLFFSACRFPSSILLLRILSYARSHWRLETINSVSS